MFGQQRLSRGDKGVVSDGLNNGALLTGLISKEVCVISEHDP